MKRYRYLARRQRGSRPHWRLLGIAAAFALLATACGTSGSAQSGTPSTTTQSKFTFVPPTMPAEPDLGVTVDTSKFKSTPPYRIGFADAGLGNSFLTMEYAEFKWGVASENGLVQPLFTNANGSINQQIADVENLLAQHVNAIILNATDPNALCPSIQKAVSQNVPVFVVERNVNCTTYTQFLNDRDDQDGYLQGAYVAQRLQGQGNVVIIGGIQGSGATVQEVNAIEHELSKYPKIHVLTVQYANYLPGTCETEMRGILAKYPSIQAIDSISGNQGVGCYDAVKQAGRVSQIKAWTGDDANGWLKIVSETHIPSIITPIPVKVGYYAVREAVKALQGQPIPKDFIVPKENITAANISQYAKPSYPDGWWYSGGMPCGFDPYCHA